jgi:hypothetical protein
MGVHRGITRARHDVHDVRYDVVVVASGAVLRLCGDMFVRWIFLVKRFTGKRQESAVRDK